MENPNSEPANSVKTLARVRDLTAEQFEHLCNRLHSYSYAVNSLTIIRDLLPPPGGPVIRCEICGQPAEQGTLNENCKRETGKTACKACIDRAIAALYGPAPTSNFIADVLAERTHA